jgi:hypothetical protein
LDTRKGTIREYYSTIIVIVKIKIIIYRNTSCLIMLTIIINKLIEKYPRKLNLI